MSIGRDVYCDTRLMLQKLEEKFPDGALGASQSDQKALEKLLEDWIVDGGVFLRMSQAIPPEMPLLKDPKFTNDREDFSGRSWSQENIKAMRPEALNHIRDAFESLENGLLADGREWILKTDKPALADIHAVWPFHWVLGMKGALPVTLVAKENFPKVFAWINRFNKAIESAKSSAPKPTTLKGADAVKHVTQADFYEGEGQVDGNDPLGLKKGQDVESWPVDSGFRHHDRGKLVSLSPKEVVIASQSQTGGKEIRIHQPRWNFRIRAVSAEEAKL